MVIKTSSSYYLYPIEKTPLNFILDKIFILNKIKNSKGRVIDDKFINFNFIEKDNNINIFFDKKNLQSYWLADIRYLSKLKYHLPKFNN